MLRSDIDHLSGPKNDLQQYATALKKLPFGLSLASCFLSNFSRDA